MDKMHLFLYRATRANTSTLDFDALAFSPFGHAKSYLFSTGIIRGAHTTNTRVLGFIPVHMFFLIRHID
jgi:hypothetical protein